MIYKLSVQSRVGDGVGINTNNGASRRRGRDTPHEIGVRKPDTVHRRNEIQIILNESSGTHVKLGLVALTILTCQGVEV